MQRMERRIRARPGPWRGCSPSLGRVASRAFCSYACSVRRYALTLLIGGVAAGVGSASSVSLEPAGIHLQSPGQSQRFFVAGGSNCEATSADPSVVRVDSQTLVARAPGKARIGVECVEGGTEATVFVGESAAAVQVGFERDLLSILTTKGCNSSACHGSPTGQNGFKLSLYGSDPRADYEMILKGHGGRRVSPGSPEDSLLLAKPTFRVAHGGGQLMTTESDEHATILEWLRQGAPYGSTGTRLERLDLHPSERVLRGPGARQAIVVIGRLSDGTTTDMTDEVRYTVIDEAVIKLDGSGGVLAKDPGMTTLMARAMGKTATAQFIVIDSDGQRTLEVPEPANFIDEHVFEKLRSVRIEPFPISDDRTFLRRVFLDAVGVLPTPGDTRRFLASTDPAKREALIDRLLERPEYSTHWLVKFEDWFRNSQYYSQGRTNGSFKRWLHDSIREDWAYDETVRAMLTAEGDTTVRPAGNFWHPAIDFMLKTFEVEKAVPTITRLFLGQRLECAQCHNHPLENLTQDDFYGLAAFLARTRVKHGYGQYRRVWYEDRRGEIEHPVTKETVPPRFLGGELAGIPEGRSRREVLADWITRTQELQFARATVNRVWYEYFRRGLVEPFDDFRSTNRPSHPELLDALARYFIDSGFRFKALHRLILNSKTYQLAAHTEDRPGGGNPLEDALFARYLPRKLPAEVLLDAISQVTGVPEEFKNYPPDTSPKELIASIGATYFLTTFGHPRRDIMGARNNNPSLSQALQMMNGDVLANRMQAEGFVLDELLSQELGDVEILTALYARAFARAPDAMERRALTEYLAKELAADRGRRQALANVLWAILNTKEFQMNL